MSLQTYSKEAVDYVQEKLTSSQKSKELPPKVFEVRLHQLTSRAPADCFHADAENLGKRTKSFSGSRRWNEVEKQ